MCCEHGDCQNCTAQRAEVKAYPQLIYGGTDPESVRFWWFQRNSHPVIPILMLHLIPDIKCSLVLPYTSHHYGTVCIMFLLPRWVPRPHVSFQCCNKTWCHPSALGTSLYPWYLHSNSAAFANIIQKDHLCKRNVYVWTSHSVAGPAAWPFMVRWKAHQPGLWSIHSPPHFMKYTGVGGGKKKKCGFSCMPTHKLFFNSWLNNTGIFKCISNGSNTL